MTRLIDADALKYKQQVTYKKGDSDELFVEWFITATEIDNAPTIDAVPQWIPCEERLPETTGKYLVSVKNGNVYANVFDGFSKKFQCAAVAWMPLPKPYDGERKDDE